MANLAQFSLAAPPGRLVFKSSEPKSIHVVLTNNGADTRVSTLPLFSKMEVAAVHADGTRLPRQENGNIAWGHYAGGSGYFPAKAEIAIDVPLKELVRGIDDPGTYDVTVIWHLYSREEKQYGCVNSPTRRITVTPG